MTQKESNSIARAITLLVLGLTFTLTLIYSLLIFAYSWMIEDNIFNRLVNSEARYIKEQYKATSKVPETRFPFMVLHKDWQGVPINIVEGYRLEPQRVEYPLASTSTANNSTAHIQVLKLDGLDYVLLADVSGYEVSRDFLPNAMKLLLAITSILILVVVIIAYLAGRRIVKPLIRLAANIASQPNSPASSDFIQSLPPNEIRTVAKSINQSFSKLNSALQRESNFTRDISHEIRTPVTVLKNALSDKGSGKLSLDQLQKAVNSCSDIELITETLLALARNESAQKTRFKLDHLVEDTLLKHYELNQTSKGQELSIDLNLSSDVAVLANQNLTEILLNNVITNAILYSTSKDIAIELTDSQLIFSNQCEDYVPSDVLTSGVKGRKSSGLGHGLSLIERICDVNGWSISTTHESTSFALTISGLQSLN